MNDGALVVVQTSLMGQGPPAVWSHTISLFSKGVKKKKNLKKDSSSTWRLAFFQCAQEGNLRLVSKKTLFFLY